MQNGISTVRSDVVTVPSTARPTPTPVRVSFGEVLAKGASTLAAGAQLALQRGDAVLQALRFLPGTTRYPSGGPCANVPSISEDNVA